MRLAPDHYQKRFRKEDGFGPADLRPLLARKGLKFLYIRKEDAPALLAGEDTGIDEILSNPNYSQEAVREAAEDSLELVHEVTLQLGFTPPVQELAQKSVQLIMRAIGSSPELSLILRKLQKQEGKYITSHSLMLAEVACALATQLGWKSPLTFMKLATAALLHDLSLTDNRLARIRRLKDIDDATDFSTADNQNLKLHPSRAAEFSREMPQLPPDIDVILTQHHERPDGSGFPRGLYSQQISPLASIFIVAHDLLDFYLDKRPANPSTNFLEAFLFEKDPEYTGGVFKKIAESMRKGEPLVLG
ncbi:MAG: HD-GYP domain-containing protein [Bacteriovoracia bacterium]